MGNRWLWLIGGVGLVLLGLYGYRALVEVRGLFEITKGSPTSNGRGRKLAIGVVIAVVLIVLCVKCAQNVMDEGGRLARGGGPSAATQARIEAKIDRTKCASNYYYYFRIADVLMRLPAVQMRGVIWPKGGANWASPGYDPTAKVVCGNSEAAAPDLYSVDINLKSELQFHDLAPTRLGKLLHQLAKSNVASVSIMVSMSKSLGRPPCYERPKTAGTAELWQVSSDGSKIFKVDFESKVASDGTWYLIDSMRSGALPAYNRLIHISDPRVGGSFQNCYKLPVDVSGGLRQRSGSFTDWQATIDEFIDETITTIPNLDLVTEGEEK